MKGKKTTWTTEMTEKLIKEFPYRFSRDIGNDLGLSIRTVIRRARELGLEKEDGFLDKNRSEISKRANQSKPPNPMKGAKGWCVPNGEKYQFRPGNIPPQKNNPELTKKIHKKRNETIKRDKLRRQYGLEPITKLNLKNIY